MPSFRKLAITLRSFKSTADYYYGSRPFSVLRFLYYSGLTINTFIVFERDLKAEIDLPAVDPDLKIIQPEPLELDRLRAHKQFPREFYYDRIHNAKTCFLGLYKGEVAFIEWVYFKGQHSRLLILRDKVAELNYVTTLPEYRGARLSARIMAHTLKNFQALGYESMVTVVHERNIAFIKSVRSVGFREIRRVRAIGPLNRRIQV
jgi:ribosomal protein S18 acetylase RimI-like enzyme